MSLTKKLVLAFLLLTVISFGVVRWVSHRSSVGQAAAEGRLTNAALTHMMNSQGRKRMAAYAGFGSYGTNKVGDWRPIPLAHYHAIMAPLMATFGRMLTILCDMLVGAIGVGLRLARRLAQPVMKLAEGARIIACGRFGARVAVTAHDEAGAPAAAFNQMADTLQENLRALQTELAERTQAQDALRQANDELARRVEERTAQLAAEIAERKQAEKALRHLQRQHQLVLNAVGEGVHALDVEGRIIFGNPAAAKLLGWEANELIGKPAHATMHHSKVDGAPYPQSECPIYASHRDGIARRISDEVFWRKDGTSFPVEYVTAPVRDENGKIIGAVVVFSDITERHRLEMQLRQAQKMDAIGQLAGGVAHDFNNLISIISGYSELLAMELAPDDPRRDSVHEIARAAERAAALTRQLLAFSRQQVLEPRVLDLNAVVTEADKMLRRLIGEDVRLTTRLGPNLSRVRADLGQLDQVILNLAINARDAMPQGGRLLIETREVELEASYAHVHPELRPGRYVVLAVTDTGCGMSPEVQAHVFEPFFTTKGEGKGTGLGLSVVHGIVQQSGGQVGVDSVPGVGTTFKVYLPALEGPAAQAAAGMPAKPPEGHGEVVLLVEDEEPVRAITVLLLENLGYRVLEAANGVEGLRLAMGNREEIALLLTDVVMPDLSGRELAETIRRRYPGLKVLFQSGYTGDVVARHGVLQAEVALLQKPFTLDALAKKVREVLES